MRGLVIICLAGLAIAAFAPATRAESAPPQPSAMERLIRQERAKRLDITTVPVAPAPTPTALQVVVADGFDWLDALAGGTATLVSRVRAA
jgi:hypothetical protein